MPSLTHLSPGDNLQVAFRREKTMFSTDRALLVTFDGESEGKRKYLAVLLAFVHQKPVFFVDSDGNESHRGSIQPIPSCPPAVAKVLLTQWRPRLEAVEQELASMCSHGEMMFEELTSPGAKELLEERALLEQGIDHLARICRS